MLVVSRDDFGVVVRDNSWKLVTNLFENAKCDRVTCEIPIIAEVSGVLSCYIRVLGLCQQGQVCFAIQ